MRGDGIGRSWRDAAIVAGFDLGESLRSRKVLAILVLYVAGAAAAAGIFLAILHEMETTLASGLMVAATRRPGTMTDALLQSEEFKEMLGHLIGDDGLAASLVRVPPLALLYGWLVFTFVPVLVVMTSADAIATDRATGSLRFAIVRTDRLAWSVGRFLGQAALLAVGVTAGAAAVWVVGGFGWAGFTPLPTAVWLARIALRGWVHGLAYLGLTLGASQLVRGANAARALALGALLAVGVLRAVLEWHRVEDVMPVAAPVLAALLPGSHTLDLWRPALLDRLPSLLALPAFGIATFAVGHAVFARRDA